MIDWLNGVLHRFQQYFSHITATVHIIHVFSTRLGLWSVLPKATPMKKSRGSSAARTKAPWIISQTFTTEPRRTPLKEEKRGFEDILEKEKILAISIISFPEVFSELPKKISDTFNLLPANAVNLNFLSLPHNLSF